MISYPRHLLGCIHFTEMVKPLQKLYGGVGKAIFHWEATWPTCLRRNIAVKLHETNLIPFKRTLLEGVQADSDPKACELIKLSKRHIWLCGATPRTDGTWEPGTWSAARERMEGRETNKDAKTQRATVVRKPQIHQEHTHSLLGAAVHTLKLSLTLERRQQEHFKEWYIRCEKPLLTPRGRKSQVGREMPETWTCFVIVRQQTTQDTWQQDSGDKGTQKRASSSCESSTGLNTKVGSSGAWALLPKAKLWFSSMVLCFLHWDKYHFP